MIVDRCLLNRVTGLVAGACCILSLTCGVVIAWQARHYQSLGRAMPNWKGGQMSTSDGRMLALLAFVMSFGFFCAAYRSWRGPSLFFRGRKGLPQASSKHPRR